LGDKKVHTQRNSVCARLPVHLKPEFLLGSAYLIAEFLSKLYLLEHQMQMRPGNIEVKVLRSRNHPYSGIKFNSSLIPGLSEMH
ncbi:MAG: hypothetical protein KA318_03440, partial [Nitrosomonas sp.]|nr:hypothetical protein [Nitrosomonas sp.]